MKYSASYRLFWFFDDQNSLIRRKQGAAVLVLDEKNRQTKTKRISVFHELDLLLVEHFCVKGRLEAGIQRCYCGSSEE